MRGNLAGATRKRTRPGYLAAWPTRQETGHQHQYVCDLAGNLRYISDPLPGKTHDAKEFRDLQLDHHFNESNAFADKGYVGCGVTTPFKKPANGELLEWHKEFNKVVNQH